MHRFYFSPSHLGGVPLCLARRWSYENSGRKNEYRGRFVWKCGRAPTTKRRGRCPHRPANIVSAQVVPKAGTSRMAGRPRRPPLQFVFGNVIQKAGRIISAPTFSHTFSKRPGRRGRRPLQFVPADVVRSTGRPRAASPTGRFRKRHSKGRADNIRPYKKYFKKVLTNVMLCGIIVLGDWYNNTPTRFQGGASNVEFYQ